MLSVRFIGIAVMLSFFPGVVAAECAVRDFFALELPEMEGRSAHAIALEIAYDDLVVSDVGGTVAGLGWVLPLGEGGDRSPWARLADPSVVEQFAQVYPLEFDLSSRLEPWFDPGRARHEGLLRSLYGQSEAEVAAQLMRVEYRGQTQSTQFAVTSRSCVAYQLNAALRAIAEMGPSMDRFFTTTGGSFNWRRIAGTDRLSAHSFGIAVDLNTQLGGYWRWSGVAEGAVGSFDSSYPEELVWQMERFGFIWGGKWHHFDGMHFEYRPELILHARLLSRAR